MMIENQIASEQNSFNAFVWPHSLEDSEGAKKKLCGSGYKEIGTRIFVPEEDAYRYALERISQDEDLKQEFLEWFYAGNWVKED